MSVVVAFPDADAFFFMFAGTSWFLMSPCLDAENEDDDDDDDNEEEENANAEDKVCI